MHGKNLTAILKKENLVFGIAVPRGSHWEIILYSGLPPHNLLIYLYPELSSSELCLLLSQVTAGVLIAHPLFLAI